MRLAFAALLSLTVLLPPTTVTVTAAQGDRTLYLHHTHTGETGRFTYKRNGRFDQGVLKDLNIFLADWRTKEPTKMDPALFDLLWSVYQEVGGREPINIVSSYRSPKTNAMLASRSSGVADNSQHMKGKAIDFFIPGVKLTLLREVAMRHQVGGVGYYPTSGSPFVHLDTGNVRAWPRMTRAQLKKVFPDGRTLHLPTDGKPLSTEGRRYAELEWKKCHSVPCGGSGPVTMLASAEEEAPVPAKRPTVMALLFGGGDQQQAQEPVAEVQVASLGGDPEQRVVPTIDIAAPMPAVRGSTLRPGQVTADGAPIPAQKSERMMLATIGTPAPGDETALAALDQLGAPAGGNGPEFVAAYVPAPAEPGAEKALQMIIDRETTASVPPQTATPALQANIQTASLGGGDPGFGSLKGMFDLTFNALAPSQERSSMTEALNRFAADMQPNPSIQPRHSELVAPEIDHVNETLVHPVLMSGEHFAVMTEAEGYLDKETELGPLTGRVGFLMEPADPVPFDRFVVGGPLLVAARLN